MKAIKTYQRWVVCVSFVFCSLSVVADTINLGVNAPRSAVKTMIKWNKLGNYLTSEMGDYVKIVPLNPAITIDAVRDGKVDFMLGNPVVTIMLREQHKGTPFATVKKKHGSQFSGAIISKKGSGIKTAADLKGKKVMSYKKKSAGAYVFQIKHLMERGVSESDFASIEIAKKQDDIVLAVKAGVIDVGFIKSGLLESMAAEGRINLNEFNVIDNQNDSLDLLHSTALYPEWCMTSVTDKGNAKMKKLKAALLKLSNDHAAAKKAKIAGFVELEELDNLADALRSLRMAPYY